jgi:hypothetical protein
MPSTYVDFCWIIEQIRADVPIFRLRQDLVYELFRRGILEVDCDNRLQLSAIGHLVFAKIASGEHAPELE